MNKRIWKKQLKRALAAPCPAPPREGDRVAGVVCRTCEAVVAATVQRRPVELTVRDAADPTGQTWHTITVPDVLTSVCDRCDTVVAIHGASTPTVVAAVQADVALRNACREARREAREDLFGRIVEIANEVDEAQHGPNPPMMRRSLHAVPVPVGRILQARIDADSEDA